MNFEERPGFGPGGTSLPSGEPRPGEAFWGYHDLVLFIAAAVPSLLLGALLMRGLFTLAGIQSHARALELVPAQFLGYLFLFAALYLQLRIQYGRPFWRALGFVPSRVSLGAAAAYGLGLAVAVALLGSLLRTPDTQTPLKELLSTRSAVLLIGFVSVTLGPLAEELAFRGFVQPLLARSLGPLAGIWLAALPFGLLHLEEYAWSWRHGLLITCAGAAFGWMRHYSGSTLAATVMHAAYNFVLFTGYFLQGKDLPKSW